MQTTAKTQTPTTNPPESGEHPAIDPRGSRPIGEQLREALGWIEDELHEEQPTGETLTSIVSLRGADYLFGRRVMQHLQHGAEGGIENLADWLEARLITAAEAVSARIGNAHTQPFLGILDARSLARTSIAWLKSGDTLLEHATCVLMEAARTGATRDSRTSLDAVSAAVGLQEMIDVYVNHGSRELAELEPDARHRVECGARHVLRGLARFVDRQSQSERDWDAILTATGRGSLEIIAYELLGDLATTLDAFEREMFVVPSVSDRAAE